MRRVIKALGIGLLVLSGVVLGRTMTRESRQIPMPEHTQLVDVDQAEAAKRLSGAIQIPTVSTKLGVVDQPAMAQMHRYLTASFPQVHQTLIREIIADHSLLYTWRGKTDAPPLLLVAHMDVVPVSPGTEAQWEEPPFSGAIKEGFIWGRGSLDDKVGVLGILEAVEIMLKAGFQPKRTVILAFGHDEEVGGTGAEAIAATLKSRDIRPALVVDEGGAITLKLVPGIDAPVALIGIAEKGYTSLELVATDPGGHSSMPPPMTAVGRIARAVRRMEDHPFPMHVSDPVKQTMAWLAPEMPFVSRLGLANLWLLSPAVKATYAKKASTSALMRTTTAVTMLSGGPKPNILPQRATAVVNFRILPGDSVASVHARTKAIIDDDEITLSPLPSVSEPSPVSDPDGAMFGIIHRAVRTSNLDAKVAPYLMVGMSDARHYTIISDAVFRFSPVRMNGADLKRLHGTNERIGVEAYAGAIRFYGALIFEADGG